MKPDPIPSRARIAVLAAALLAVAGIQHVHASSDDAWEEFRQNVEKACRDAAGSVLEVKAIQVDPFGSQSYGFAIISGVEPGTSTERLLACAYDKKSQAAEISGVFDR